MDLEDYVFYTEVSDYTEVSGMIIKFEDEYSVEEFYFLFVPRRGFGRLPE